MATTLGAATVAQVGRDTVSHLATYAGCWVWIGIGRVWLRHKYESTGSRDLCGAPSAPGTMAAVCTIGGNQSPQLSKAEQTSSLLSGALRPPYTQCVTYWEPLNYMEGMLRCTERVRGTR